MGRAATSVTGSLPPNVAGRTLADLILERDTAADASCRGCSIARDVGSPSRCAGWASTSAFARDAGADEVERRTGRRVVAGARGHATAGTLIGRGRCAAVLVYARRMVERRRCAPLHRVLRRSRRREPRRGRARRRRPRRRRPCSTSRTRSGYSETAFLVAVRDAQVTTGFATSARSRRFPSAATPRSPRRSRSRTTVAAQRCVSRRWPARCR